MSDLQEKEKENTHLKRELTQQNQRLEEKDYFIKSLEDEMLNLKNQLLNCEKKITDFKEEKFIATFEIDKKNTSSDHYRLQSDVL